MAIHHPERLRSITSANCVASYPEEGKKVWAERIGQVRENGLASLLDGTIQRWFTADFIAANTTLVEQVKAMILATPESGYIGCCGALSQLAYQEGLASINVPTLFVAGTHDQGAPAAAMRAMHEAVTGSGYVELDAAHVSNLECPSEFTEALLSVIER